MKPTEVKRWAVCRLNHYSDVIMCAMASQITSLAIVYSTVYSGADQRKYQSSASLAFVRGIHRWPVNSPHKWPAKWKIFPFDDVIMTVFICFSTTMTRHLSSPYNILSVDFEFTGPVDDTATQCIRHNTDCKVYNFCWLDDVIYYDRLGNILSVNIYRL